MGTIERRRRQVSGVNTLIKKSKIKESRKSGYRFIIGEGEIYFDSFGFLVLAFVLIICIQMGFSLRL